MANIDNQYRMLWSSISNSKKIRAISGDKWFRIGCHLVYTWMIPWADDDGRLRGEPIWVLANILPNEGMDEAEISAMLMEVHRVGLITWYQVDGERFIQIIDNENHQMIRKDRYKPSIYPSCDQVTTSCRPSDNQVTTSLPQICNPLSLSVSESSSSEQGSNDPCLSETAETVSDGNGKPPPCPQSEIVNLYHQTLPELPRVKHWPENLQAILRTRWKEDPVRQNLAWWENFFRYVHESDFLTGRSRETFVADLEWLVRPRNFTKIANGRYHARGSTLSSKHQPGIAAWLERRSENAAVR